MLKVVLYRNRRYILSPCRDNEFLDAPRNLQVSILFKFALVPTAHKTLVVNTLHRRVVVFEVAHHSVAPSHADFTFPILVRVEDFHVRAWNRVARRV